MDMGHVIHEPTPLLTVFTWFQSSPMIDHSSKVILGWINTIFMIKKI